MTTRTHGFAYPLKYDEVKPGMLISAKYGSRHILGLAYAGEREPLLAVFADSGESEPKPPYVLELNAVHDSLTLIPGDRHFEPVGETSFHLLPLRRIGGEGFVIASDGRVGLAVVHRDFGQSKFMILDFETGAPLAQTGQLAMLPAYRLFVAEAGRDTRREVVVHSAS